MKKILLSPILAIILLSSVFTMNFVFGDDSTKKVEVKKLDKKKMSDAKNAEKIKLAKERYAAKKLSKKNTLDDKKSESIPIGRGLTHDELIQYALKKINQDRQKYNFPPVSLSSNSAAQIHAEDVQKTRMISHWMSNGEKPYMTYTRLGGTGSVSQNVAISICSEFGCNVDRIKQIESLEYAMMYDDASSDWGHRDNILQPYHTQVAIGISYDDSFFTMVQNFEENYLLSENPITITGGNVQIHSNLKKVLPVTVAIFYDPLPTPDAYSQHLMDHSYSMGDLVAVVQRPAPVNYYYDQPSGYKLIEATRWDIDTTSIFIDFDASTVFSQPGVYTIGVQMNVDGKVTWITNYSKIYKSPQIDELQTQMSEKERKITDEKNFGYAKTLANKTLEEAKKLADKKALDAKKLADKNALDAKKLDYAKTLVNKKLDEAKKLADKTLADKKAADAKKLEDAKKLIAAKKAAEAKK